MELWSRCRTMGLRLAFLVSVCLLQARPPSSLFLLGSRFSFPFRSFFFCLNLFLILPLSFFFSFVFRSLFGRPGNDRKWNCEDTHLRFLKKKKRKQRISLSEAFYFFFFLSFLSNQLKFEITRNSTATLRQFFFVNLNLHISNETDGSSLNFAEFEFHVKVSLTVSVASTERSDARFLLTASATSGWGKRVLFLLHWNTYIVDTVIRNST